MLTLHRRRWQGVLIVFACSLPVILWIFGGLSGRSLSALVVVGVAAGGAAFTWALHSDRRAQITAEGLQALDRGAANDFSSVSSRVEKSIAALGPKPQGPVKRLKPTEISARRLSASGIESRKGSPLMEAQGASERVAPRPPLNRPIEQAPTLTAATKSRGEGVRPAKAHVFEGGIRREQTVRREDASKKICSLRWCGQGETVTAGEYLLRDPMVYVSPGRPPEEEASCIDLSLEVGQPLAENVVGLRRNPTYALLSPNQRAYYLRWISNGRVGALENIGFASVFFYGLERRLLVDQQDHGPIVDEVVRLLGTYPSFGLFNAQLSLFLAFTLARLGIDSITDSVFTYIFEKRH